MANSYSVFVRNAEGGLVEFYNLSKMEALNIVEEMKNYGFTEHDMVPIYNTPLFTDSLEAKEDNDGLE